MTGLWWLLAVPVALLVDWALGGGLGRFVDEMACPGMDDAGPAAVQCPGCMLWDGDHSFACGGLYDDGETSPWPMDHASVRAARK